MKHLQPERPGPIIKDDRVPLASGPSKALPVENPSLSWGGIEIMNHKKLNGIREQQGLYQAYTATSEIRNPKLENELLNLRMSQIELLAQVVKTYRELEILQSGSGSVNRDDLEPILFRLRSLIEKMG